MQHSCHLVAKLDVPRVGEALRRGGEAGFILRCDNLNSVVEGPLWEAADGVLRISATEAVDAALPITSGVPDRV